MKKNCNICDWGQK